MQIQQDRVQLIKPYATTKLNHNTLKAVIKSPLETVYRLYLIAEGIKEVQEFATIHSDEYSLTAIVKTECAFIGEAKDQIRTIPKLNALLTRRPLYIVKCELRHLMTNDIVYRCEFKHNKEAAIYNQIQECINQLNHIKK